MITQRIFENGDRHSSVHAFDGIPKCWQVEDVDLL